MKKKPGKNKEFEITELFMIKAGKTDWNRTFIGSIKRETTAEGEPVVRMSVTVNEGMIVGMARDQDELGANLDDVCLMKLDYGLHCADGPKSQIFSADFYHN
jgi:hypothetical protein